MEQFARWFISFFKLIVNNIFGIFKTFFSIFENIFYFYPKKFVEDFNQYKSGFNVGAWILAIISIIITIVFFAVVIYALFLLLKRYFRFTKKERDKDDLLHEIALLNNKIVELVDEKNANLILSGEENIITKQFGNSKLTKKNEKNRFVKLNLVDEKYHFTLLQTKMGPEDELDLKQLVTRFVNFSASQLHLYYSEKIVRVFFAGMATSKTMILEGISGTGKTSLPYAMGKFFNNDANIISVQPSWRDRAEMLGYLNEFTKKFNETEFLKALYEVSYRNDVNFIVLDEMNLARVEYYFADFLSLLEMPNPNEWLVELVPDQIPGDPNNLIEGKILVPQNVWFVGTANKDDSTFTITDKVYDRAASIEINNKANVINAPYTTGIKMTYEYIDRLFKQATESYKISEKMLDNLRKLDEYIIEKFQIAFGNRIMKQINSFIPVYVACGGDELEGLDFMVARKVIRKFESLNLPFLQNELQELLVVFDKLFGKNSFVESKKMIENFLKQI